MGTDQGRRYHMSTPNSQFQPPITKTAGLLGELGFGSWELTGAFYKLASACFTFA